MTIMRGVATVEGVGVMSVQSTLVSPRKFLDLHALRLNLDLELSDPNCRISGIQVSILAQDSCNMILYDYNSIVIGLMNDDLNM